jgi:hypothetical protein
MREFWTMPTANMMYTQSQNYTNMLVGEHGIQTFELVIVILLLVLLSFAIFVPTSAHLLLL